MNVRRRERNQQDATNLMFIIKLLSRHVSGIIMPIIWQAYGLDTNRTSRHTRIHTESQLRLQLITPRKDATALTSYRFLPLLLQCWTPYAVVHGLVLLKMDIMMPKTCRDRSLIINIRLVASCWFLSLHRVHDAWSHEPKTVQLVKVEVRSPFWKTVPRSAASPSHFLPCTFSL